MMTSFQSNVIGGEEIIPMEDRIITNCGHLEILVGRMNQYGEKIGDPQLCRELQRLARQVERTLKRAQVVRGDFYLTDAAKAALNGEGE